MRKTVECADSIEESLRLTRDGGVSVVVTATPNRVYVEVRRGVTSFLSSRVWDTTEPLMHSIDAALDQAVADWVAGE